MKNRVLWHDYGSLGGVPCTRQRKAVDDVRLLFQSMVKGREEDEKCNEQRSEDDDEDLLDALFVIMHKIHEDRSPKLGTTRASVVQAAAALPSSCSRSLEERVEVRDVRRLLELVVALLDSRLVGTGVRSDSSVVDCMMSAFFSTGSDNRGVGWEDFRDVVLGSFVKHLPFPSPEQIR
jgi:hypothetical protein